MLAEPVQFDTTDSRMSYSDQPVPPGGVPRALRQAAESTGLDVVAELYNESLRYATEGHFRHARERLSVLLAIAPEDGEARLLLAKVLVAGQRWKEALAALDEAVACGIDIPGHLRGAVEEHLRAEQAAESEHTVARAAREQGEIKALRQEARRLRSENAQMVGRTRELEKELRKWAWTTAAVTSLAILFIAGNLLFGGGGASEPEADLVADAAAEEVTAPAAPALAAVPADAPPLAERAARALQVVSGLDGTALELELRGDEAILRGTVATHRQLRRAEQTLRGVDGISEVDVQPVVVQALARGATHTVVKGDTLSKISLDYYGTSTHTAAILKANRAVLKGRPDLQIGMVLAVPPVR